MDLKRYFLGQCLVQEDLYPLYFRVAVIKTFKGALVTKMSIFNTQAKVRCLPLVFSAQCLLYGTLSHL